LTRRKAVASRVIDLVKTILVQATSQRDLLWRRTPNRNWSVMPRRLIFVVPVQSNRVAPHDGILVEEERVAVPAHALEDATVRFREKTVELVGLYRGKCS
jgi:hypothetical protein